MSANLIFLMSSERSGSNLLRTLIANHSQVSGPRAPHLLDVFADLWMYYDTTGERDGYINILKDMLRIVNHPYYGWDLEVSAPFLYGKENPESFLDCFQALYNQSARSLVSEYIVCKENKLFDYAIPLLDHFENCSFIYLYRDPRDYTRSWLKTPVHINSVPRAAQTWSREQQACIRLRDMYQIPTVSVSYEGLIGDPSDTMKDVLTHIGLAIESDCFSTQKSDDPLVEKNEYWKNLNKPIDSSNKNKYKDYFEKDDINRIETEAKDEMVYLGYDLDTLANWTPPERSLTDRVASVSYRAWAYFNRDIIGVDWTSDEDKVEESETTQMISDVMSLRQDIESCRKNKWYDRKNVDVGSKSIVEN